ncbi:MAG: lipopolysaccharide biosynthesis protein [Methylophilaceae bacterium]
MTVPSKSKILNSVLWSGVRVWGNRLGGIMIFFVLARLLSPEDMGVYAVIWSILLFLEVFTEQGLADAIIQSKQIKSNQLNTVFVINLVMALLIAIAIILNADKIASLVNMPEIATSLQVATLALIFNAIGFCQLALYRRNFEYRWLAIRTLTATVISGAVGITMAFYGYGAWALIVQFILAALINTVWLWIRPLWKPSFDFTLNGLKDLMKFSVKLMSARLFDATSTRAFEFVIAVWLGAATLGIYTVGSRIYTVMLQLLSNVILDVAHSGFSRLVDDKTKFLNSYYKSIIATASIAVPTFVILAAVASEFCVALFGAKWAESGNILHILALLGAVQAVQQINIAAINGLGFTGVQFIVAFLRALGTMAVLLMYGHGNLILLTLAYCIIQLPLCPISFILGKKHIQFNWRDLMVKTYPFIIGSAAAYYAIYYVRSVYPYNNVWLALISLSFLGLIVYIVSVLLIRPQYLKVAFFYLQNKNTT